MKRTRWSRSGRKSGSMEGERGKREPGIVIDGRRLSARMRGTGAAGACFGDGAREEEEEDWESVY